jgi:hypothetical protein
LKIILRETNVFEMKVETDRKEKGELKEREIVCSCLKTIFYFSKKKKKKFYCVPLIRTTATKKTKQFLKENLKCLKY